MRKWFLDTTVSVVTQNICTHTYVSDAQQDCMLLTHKHWSAHVSAQMQKKNETSLSFALELQLFVFAQRHYCTADGGSPDLSVSVAAQMWGNTWSQRLWDEEELLK